MQRLNPLAVGVAAPASGPLPHRPTLHAEEALWAGGLDYLAGVDEVGRGPLAGPVVAAAVVLPPRSWQNWYDLVRDSKLLSPARREALAAVIQREVLSASTGEASAGEVDALGIVAATFAAMRRALASLGVAVQHVLVDGCAMAGCPLPQTPMVDGDARCVSIAAASVVAKVYRDHLMEQQEALYPGYGFASHKGYGTALHFARLMALGPCPLHRQSFAPVRQLCQDAKGSPPDA